jgi:hypothetical protein
MVGQGVGSMTGSLAGGEAGGRLLLAWASLLLSSRAIRSQPPMNPITLSAARVTLALLVNLALFRIIV